MTDQTIPAGKIREVIKKMKDNRAGVDDSNHGRGYHQALTNYIPDLEALLPKPPTLADELRKPIPTEANTAWFEVSELRALADRVETLEQERDIATGALKVEAEVTSEALDRVEEQAAEITRLEGLEVPGGWRVATHAHFGPVIAVADLDGGKHHCVFRSNVGPGFSQTLADPALLSFCDEAPAPEDTPEPEHIDPATCGQYDWYLIEYSGREYHGIRIDPTDRSHVWGFISPDGRFTFAGDDDLTVIRPLTSEEMDAR